jgi:hypothetical protein
MGLIQNASRDKIQVATEGIFFVNDLTEVELQVKL